MMLELIYYFLMITHTWQKHKPSHEWAALVQREFSQSFLFDTVNIWAAHVENVITHEMRA